MVEFSVKDTSLWAVKFTLQRMVVFTLLVPVSLSLVILIFQVLATRDAKAEVKIAYFLGKEIVSAEQLDNYAYMVYEMNQDDDREAFQKIINEVDQSLDILHKGGEIDGDILPPPPNAYIFSN